MTGHHCKLNQETIFVIILLINFACCFPKHCKWRNNNSITCGNAGLTKIPEGIPTSTEYLDFSNNPSLIFEDDYFLRFTNLQTLYLQNCSRTRPVFIPSTLKQLYLKDNKLRKESVIQMFKNRSSSLRFLDLERNLLQLKDILEFLPHASVVYLILKGNTMPVIHQHHFLGFMKLQRLNLDNCGIERISRHSFDSLRFLLTLRLTKNHLKSLPRGLFSSLKRLLYLRLDDNKFDKTPDIRGPLFLSELNLNGNKIKKISQHNFFSSKIGLLRLRNNQIRSFDLRYTRYLGIDLSYNNISKLNDLAFEGSKNIFFIRLQNNNLSSISPLAFHGILQIGSLYLHRNNIRTLHPDVFKGLRITNLFLYGNQIESMNGVLTTMKSPPKLLLLMANPRLHEFKINEYQTMANKSNIYISCNAVKQFSGYGEFRANVRCFPSTSFSIHTSDHDLQKDGYNCTADEGGLSVKCTPCPIGYFTSSKSKRCKTCPAGSFYQDELALTYCKHCPDGQYVPPDRSPGKSPLECLTCPDGTRKKQTAGYRACPCLNGFARTDRFGQCNKCTDEGISCDPHDYPILQRGYWWSWHRKSPSNLTCKDAFIAFMRNLDTKDDTYDRSTTNFTCQLPQPHRCPIKWSCLGGVNATCKTGYKGILCSVCEKGYSRQFQKCIKCPKTVFAVLQLLGYLALFLIICVVVSWTDTIKSEDEDYRRTYADIILSNLKILVGFYQVLVACLNAFSFVNWPNSLKKTIGFFKFVQFEVIRMPSFRCIKPEWHLNAIDEFWIAIIGTVAFPIVIMLYFAIKKIYFYLTLNLPGEFSRQSIKCKKKCLRVIALFLFVTYPSTSQRIVNVLPLRCDNICTHVNNGHCLDKLKYMRADYSVKCLSFSDHNHLTLVFAYIAMVIPVGLPMILFLLLWKFAPKGLTEQQENLMINENRERTEVDNVGHERVGNGLLIIGDGSETEDNSLQFALKFLYENYTTSNRYWESLEMVRKLIMTVGITIFVGYGYYKIVMSMTIAVAGFFAVFHAYRRPMRNNFENGVQLVSLSIASLNVCFGLILQSRWYKDYRQKNGDNLAVGIMFVALNLFVFVLVAIRLMPTFFKALKVLCKTLASCCYLKCKRKFASNELINDSNDYVEAVYLLGDH